MAACSSSMWEAETEDSWDKCQIGGLWVQLRDLASIYKVEIEQADTQYQCLASLYKYIHIRPQP